MVLFLSLMKDKIKEKMFRKNYQQNIFKDKKSYLCK